MANRRKKKSFIDLPLRRRRDRFVSERWQIAKDLDAPGVFRTHIILPGSKADLGGKVYGPGETNASASCVFISKRHADQGIVYHAEIITPEVAIIHAIEKMIDQKVEEALGHAGLKLGDVWPDSRFILSSGTGKKALYTWECDPFPQIAAFGGKTIHGLEADILGRASQSTWPKISYGAKNSCKCPTAIDIEIVVPETNLDVSAVARTVEAFWESGEEIGVGQEVPLDSYIAAADRYIAREMDQKMKYDLEERKISFDEMEKEK